MLFKTRFLEGIRSGAITLTFRAWQGQRVTPGRTYPCGGAGFIEVDEVDRVAVGEIGEQEARASGFDSTAELLGMLRKTSSRRLTRRSEVYRVRFHFLGRSRPDSQAGSPEPSLDELAARLERMERLSKRGPWTSLVLELIEANPRIAASRLAPRLGRETRPFKADVRKLKRLGLTHSFEVGYELTALGSQLLRRKRSSKP